MVLSQPFLLRNNVVQPPGTGMSGGSTVDIKYLTQPHDGTPGKPWDDFEERLLDVASGKTDERVVTRGLSQPP